MLIRFPLFQIIEEVTLSVSISGKLQAIIHEDNSEMQCLKQNWYRDSEVKIVRAERKLKAMQAKYQQGIKAL